MTRKRIICIVLCVFFLLIGVATTTRDHIWRRKLDDVDRQIQQLETRRDSLIQTVDALEKRCEELGHRISEQENTRGD